MDYIKRFFSGTGLFTAAITLGASMAVAASEHDQGYEVWASDQSNSVPGQAAGTKGGFIWIWDSEDIKRQIAGGPEAQPLGCDVPFGPRSPQNAGPCDLLDMFPPDLVETGPDGEPTGKVLADLSGFGRLHGMLPDPQGRYVSASIFAPGGGYVGIIDTWRKEAVALFRVTGTNVGGGTDVRSVHMSFWDPTGSSLIVANLNGKVLERIDIERDQKDRIVSARFNRTASLGVGKNMEVTTTATTFRGKNAHGRGLIGEVVGDYAQSAFGNLTANGFCKENGCGEGHGDGSLGGRPNNVIICPIPSGKGNSYVTLGGGGMLVANTDETPMTIVGEYSSQIVPGAGCGGAQSGDNMFINAGVSAAAGGATWSVFDVYAFSDSAYATVQMPNTPLPQHVYGDPDNTATGGRMSGPSGNLTGQIPGVTTRRDSHGAVTTMDGSYVHIVDRIQNVVEVFDAQTFDRTSYDLTSEDGQGNGFGACAAKSVDDDGHLPGNDPAPDLLDRTRDGKYLLVALRGPAPVSVNHGAQGSCPGVGVIELTDGGRSGRMIDVLRTSNVVDTSPVSAPGGHAYIGAERSDVHDVTVVRKGPGPAGPAGARGKR